MKIKHELEIKPFSVPDSVSLKIEHSGNHWSTYPTIPLSELEKDVLQELCDQFTKDVFIKAGKL